MQGSDERVAFHQPSFRWYRVGLFSDLSRKPLIRVDVYYDGSASGNVSNESLSHLNAFPVADRKLLRGRLYWSSTQLKLANRKMYARIVYPWNSRYISLPLALLVARIRGKRVFLWGHGYSQEHSSTWRDSYRNALAYLASGVLLYSDYPLPFLPLRIRRKAIVVGNELFRSVERSTARLTARSSCRSIRLLHIGQLRLNRRLDLALGAVAELRRRGWDVHFLIVGDGPALDRLQREAADLGIEQQVEFLHQVFDDQHIAHLFKDADVATFAASGGLGVIDALQHGVPVTLSGLRWHHPPEAAVVFDRLPELVDTTVTPEGLADAIELAITSDSVRERVAAIAQKLHDNSGRMVATFYETLTR